MKLRSMLNDKPMLGWIVAGIAFVAAGFFLLRSPLRNAPDSVEKLSQMVTIRCTETGNEWEMNRGELMQMLMEQPGPVDPNRGIPSKFAEGRPTGVIVDKGSWNETVNYVNALKKAVAKRNHTGG